MALNYTNTLENKNGTPLPQDRPSRRILRTWARRIKNGEANTIPVYVGGSWSLQIMRGHKRALQLGLSINN